jgi:hypothetical protein
MYSKLGNELSVLVLSCDKYSHLLPYFTTVFDKYWGLKNICKKYIVTESTIVEHDDYIPILTNESNWTLATAMALSQIETPYVFLILDDFLLWRDFPAADIYEGLSIIKEANLDKFVYHYPHAVFDNKLEPTKYGASIGKIRQDSEYTMTVQPSIWNVDFFKKCLFETESPWEFEINGSERVNSTMTHKIYMKTIPYGYHIEAMTRGQLTEQFHNLIQVENLI